MPAPAFSLSRVWRILATGIAFATFMLGGLALALTAFPLLRLWPGTDEAKGRRIRQLIRVSFAAFLKFMTGLGIMGAPQVEGVARVLKAGPCLIIANHPTLIDVVLLVSLVQDGNCVVKRALWAWIPDPQGTHHHVDQLARMEGCDWPEMQGA